MKKIILNTILLFCLHLASAQVGIGTTNPTEMLDVNGDVLLNNNIKIDGLNEIPNTEEYFKFLVRVNNSSPAGVLKRLKANEIKKTPMRLQSYKITNIDKDNVKDIDLQLDANKYIVSISNFKWNGPGMPKKVNGVKNGATSGLFNYRVFKSGNTWHLEIRNVYLDTKTTSNVIYEIDLVIYQKKYFVELPSVTSDLGGNEVGTATTSQIPNFLQ